jgi:hypothetical protein
MRIPGLVLIPDAKALGDIPLVNLAHQASVGPSPVVRS